MSATVDQVASACGADPADVTTLLASYPAEIDDLWEEAGVLSGLGVEEAHRVFNPLAIRTMGHMYQSWGYHPPAHFVLDW